MTIKASARQAARRIGLEVDRWPARHTLEAALQRILTTYGVDSVVDVGANEGDWSANIRRLGHTGPLLSIEPVSDAHAVLRSRAASDSDWTTLRVAVGATGGRVSLNISARTTLSSTLEVEHETVATMSAEAASRIEVLRTESVDRVTLDSLNVSGQRVLLKIDTQGTDRSVLLGAEKLLLQTSAIQCELSLIPLYHGVDNEWRSTIDYLGDLGFTLAGLYGIAADESLRLQEIDGLFVRSSAVARPEPSSPMAPA